MSQVHARPFVKWAGGKRQLLAAFQELYPNKLRNGKVTKYIEPFVGGGAVFFELASKYEFKEMVINDVNTVLISSYFVIKHDVAKLISALEELQKNYLEKTMEERESFYYWVREEYNGLKQQVRFENENTVIDGVLIETCAYFLFLNKTCFNGLYRENKKGGFNVPFGKYKNPTIVDAENLLNVSALLQNTKIVSGDFERLTDEVTENSFVYMDPPYRPLTVTSSFSSYSKGDFNDDEQIRLATWFRTISDTGAALMLSNSNPKNANPGDTFFDDLYKGFKICDTVFASRAINSKASKRGAISELVIISEGKE